MLKPTCCFPRESSSSFCGTVWCNTAVTVHRSRLLAFRTCLQWQLHVNYAIGKGKLMVPQEFMEDVYIHVFGWLWNPILNLIPIELETCMRVYNWLKYLQCFTYTEGSTIQVYIYMYVYIHIYITLFPIFRSDWVTNFTRLLKQTPHNSIVIPSRRIHLYNTDKSTPVFY